MSAYIHGKNTVFKVSATDISAYCNTSEVTKEYDEHDVTGYGASGHAVQGGLQASKITVGGNYFSGTGGPRAVIEPLLGTNVTVLRQPEGVGSGLPQDSATCHVKNYVETNPVAGMITWTAELTVSGVINSAAQS